LWRNGHVPKNGAVNVQTNLAGRARVCGNLADARGAMLVLQVCNVSTANAKRWRDSSNGRERSCQKADAPRVRRRLFDHLPLVEKVPFQD
jgi:hypothetical protein